MIKVKYNLTLRLHKYYLFWVVLESEECGVDEDEPTNHPQDNQSIAEGRLIKVENLPGVEIKFLTEEQSHVHDHIGADENSHFDG